MARPVLGFLHHNQGQHRTIWQEHSAKDFASYESYKRAGILYVFPPFITARMGQKIGRRPQTQLCGDAQGVLQGQNGDQGVYEVYRPQLRHQNIAAGATPLSKKVDKGHGDFPSGIGGHGDSGVQTEIHGLGKQRHHGNRRSQREIQNKKQRCADLKGPAPAAIPRGLRLGAVSFLHHKNAAPDGSKQKEENADAPVP